MMSKKNRYPNPYNKAPRRPRQSLNSPSIYISLNVPTFIHIDPLATYKCKAFITLDKFSPNQSSPDIVYQTQLTRYMGIKIKSFTCCLNKEQGNTAEVMITNTRRDMPFNFSELVLNNIMAVPKTRLNRLDSRYQNYPQTPHRRNDSNHTAPNTQRPQQNGRKGPKPYSPTSPFLSNSPRLDYSPHSPAMDYVNSDITLPFNSSPVHSPNSTDENTPSNSSTYPNPDDTDHLNPQPNLSPQQSTIHPSPDTLDTNLESDEILMNSPSSFPSLDI